MVLQEEKTDNRGRPSKLTHEMIAKITTAIELTSLPMDRIAPRCGITKQTYYSWLKKGETIINCRDLPDDDPDKIDVDALSDYEHLCAELYLAVDDAYSQREEVWLSQIKDIARRKGDWRAIMWMLKIHHPVYRTAELPPEPEPEEEDYDDDDMFDEPAPYEETIDVNQDTSDIDVDEDDEDAENFDDDGFFTDGDDNDDLEDELEDELDEEDENEEFEETHNEFQEET